MNIPDVRALLVVALPLLYWGSSAQVKEQNKTIIINGQSGNAGFVHVNGREYIAIEALVRITNGSMTFQDGMTRLTLMAPEKDNEPQSNGDPNLLSQSFRRSGIEEIALLREWVSPLAIATQNGFPVKESWVAGFQSKAITGLGIASVAVSTPGDQSAFALLNNEFDLVQKWSNKLLDAHKTLSAGNYALSPDALRNEALSQQMIACAQFLDSMLAVGSFHDDIPCR